MITPRAATTAPFRIGEWRIEPDSGRMTRDGESIRIEARTMRLLVYLAERAGEVVSIDELLDKIWPGVIVTQDSVYQAIASLRRQLRDDPGSPTIIATVPKRGYRLIAAVHADSGLPLVEPAPVGGAAHAAAGRVDDSKPTRRRLALLIGIAAVALAAASAYPLFGTHPLVKSVGVLPFLDLTTQQMNEEYFADGLTEELIGSLSKFPNLRVPAPTASFFLKGKQLPVRDIGRQLAVDYVVDGSVRKSGNLYRVSIRLVQAGDGYVLWSDAYERPLGDLLAVQKQIAAAAADAIRESLRRSATHPTRPV